MRYLTAQPTAHARGVDSDYLIPLQRVGIGLERQRRTAVVPDTDVITGADILVDAKLWLGHGFALGHLLLPKRLLPTLALQHAFAVGDDHLETGVSGREGARKSAHSAVHVVGIDARDPFHTH